MKQIFFTLFIFITSLSIPAHALELELPVQCKLGVECFIQNYVDQGRTDTYHDFRCRPLSYNGHKGTDIRMPVMNPDAASVAVLAAADGIVARIRDGEEERFFTKEQQSLVKDKECGNGLVITHTEGWETQYCHLRKGSIVVQQGQQVKAGDALGQIGLSGMTEFPHLHFQVTHNGTIIDPFNAKPMETGCAVQQQQLWSEKARAALDINETGLLAFGVANTMPKLADVLLAKHQSLTIKADNRPLVFWTLSYGLQQGDTLTMMLFAPDNTPLVENTLVIEGFKAQYFQYIGKNGGKDAPPFWDAGIYQAMVTLSRNGETVFNRSLKFTIVH